MFKQVKQNLLYLSGKFEFIESLATLCDDTLTLLSPSEVTPLSVVQLIYSLLTFLFHLTQL